MFLVNVDINDLEDFSHPIISKFDKFPFATTYFHVYSQELIDGKYLFIFI